MKNSKIKFVFVVLLMFIIADNLGLIFNLDKSIYNRSANFEYNHLYPQKYFKYAQGEIDNVTLRLRNYEHIKWLHSKSYYDKDWDDVKGNVPLIFKIFGGSTAQLIQEGELRLYPKRNAAIIAGSNIISYQWLVYNYKTKTVSTPKFLFAMNFDGVSNCLYNISYITSIPYKFIYFTNLCFTNISILGFRNCLMLFIWMFIQIIFGFFSSCVMLSVGLFIGTLCHPLETIANLTISINSPLMNNLLVTFIDLIKSILKPVIRIFFNA